jgi:glutathione peroxidase
MTKILLVLFSIITLNINAQSFYDLEAKTIDGEIFKFETLKGKKVMIVNVASKCGFTPQYEDLEKLWQTYKDKNFVILGFPSNDFLKQEPGTDQEIKEFCTLNYGVTFQMMSKISVKGDEMDPVYQWLTMKGKNGLKDSKVKWNFQKYIIDENGRLIEYFDSAVKPFDENIIKLIE